MTSNHDYLPRREKDLAVWAKNAKYRITEPPESDGDLPYPVFTTRKKRLFDFDRESDKAVYFYLRCENTRSPKAAKVRLAPSWRPSFRRNDESSCKLSPKG